MFGILSESGLVSALVFVELGVKSVAEHRGEQFVLLWEGTDWATVFWFCRVRTGSHDVLLDDQVEDFKFHFSSSAPLRSSALISLLSDVFILNSITVNYGICLAC